MINKQINFMAFKFGLIFFTMFCISGCNSLFPEIKQNISQNDIDLFSENLGIQQQYITEKNINKTEWRKDYITMKMYEIDREYELYWQQISEEDAFISLGGNIAQLGLNTAATAIPVGQTTKVLAAIATGVTGSKSAYKQELLLEKTKEALKTQADKNKESVGKTIRMRLKICMVNQYPWGSVLSDLESYRRAGSFNSALTSVIQSVNNSKAVAEKDTGKAKPVTIQDETGIKKSDKSQSPCPM